jgi:hypothetical protein
MKTKILLSLIVAASVALSSTMFGQSLQITGKVTAVTSSQIALQSGTDNWTINRTSSTTVTSGNLTVGSMATIQCASVDAQKKEAPAAGTPTPAGS